VVRDHDPPLALDGGRDGLDPYRILAGTLRERLADGGHVLLEIGAGQEEDVKAIMREGGFIWLESRCDLGGHPRALIFALH
jgi:release factor glutamine methyltransferase